MEKYARRIHRALRSCEDLTDRLIGRTGPIFVTFAVALLVPCTFSFFEVIFTHTFAHSSLLTRLLALLYCVWHATVVFYNYYKAVSVSPGFAAAAGPATRHCAKCTAAKPERAHHCRVCNRCVLKYDHHCPWINQCVGLGNERYFVLFMIYLSTACLIVGVMGYSAIFNEVLPLRGSAEWGRRYYSPPFVAMLTWMLAMLIGAVVGVMAAWQLSLAVGGMTSVEHEDRRAYKKAMKSERRSDHIHTQTPINPYDFGWRENLALFFNVGSGRRHYAALLLPIPHLPCGDGYTFAKKFTHGLHLQFDSESEGEEV